MAAPAHTGHIGSLKLYLGIWGLLLLLTFTTVMVAFVDLGPFNIVVALVIATIKGSLVALFFMHLRESSKMTMIVAVASLFWLFILLSLTMTDYVSRAWSTRLH
ncbi:MAG TPA: cytochrome C oxidase subunit IV family protein [Terriglobales bacterium]|nr:cytochrome C oxidase subunit IV family protein [Terriglobales bacterium]